MFQSEATRIKLTAEDRKTLPEGTRRFNPLISGKAMQEARLLQRRNVCAQKKTLKKDDSSIQFLLPGWTSNYRYSWTPHSPEARGSASAASFCVRAVSSACAASGMAVINTDLCVSNEWSSGGSGTPGCRKGCGANCGKGGIPAKGGRLKELASEGSRGESIKS